MYYLVFQELVDGPYEAQEVSGPEPEDWEYDEIIGQMGWGQGVFEADTPEQAIEKAEEADLDRYIDQGYTVTVLDDGTVTITR